MVKVNMNSKPKDSQKTKKQRLAPRILYKTVCEILEEALKEDSTIESEDGGFVRIDIIDDYILEKQDEIVTKRERDNYTTDYKAYELIKQVNTALKKIGKEVICKKINKRLHYKGYIGIFADFEYVSTMMRELPVDKGVFEFIKGTMDFNTMSSIRNRINDLAEKAWTTFVEENPQYNIKLEEERILADKSKNDEKKAESIKARRGIIKAEEKKMKAKIKPDAPFICIEGSIYEFTKDYEMKTARERELLLKFADAIICQKAVKVSYQALHYDKPDDLEFHPHYIRKVGNKLMIYGRSRSIEFHKPDEYTLVNLIVHRVHDVTDFETPVKYYSAKELGLDYNNEVFFNRVTFDAPGFLMGEETCTEVILKVRKTVETPGNPKKPFQRMLSEPLHHSQKVLTEREDEEFGYVSIFVKDYMRMKPILLKWGCDVYVESPEHLHNIMQDEVRRMAETYGIINH